MSFSLRRVSARKGGWVGGWAPRLTRLFYSNCFREENLTCQRCALQNLHLSHVRAVFPLQFRAFPSRLRPLFFIAFVFFLHHGNFFSRVVHDRAIFLVIHHQPQIPFRIGRRDVVHHFQVSRQLFLRAAAGAAALVVGFASEKVERNSPHFFIA